MATQKVLHFKLVLLGDVEKSPFIVRACLSIGENGDPVYCRKIVQLEDRLVKFEIWDTFRGHTFVPMYLKGAGAAVVLYDVTEKSSFISAKSLVNQIQRRGEPNVVIALTGIVNEKNESKKTVVCDEAQEFALAHGLIFMEITLPTGHNIEMLFEEIALKLPESIPIPEKEPFPIVPPRKSNSVWKTLREYWWG